MSSAWAKAKARLAKELQEGNIRLTREPLLTL
jgi:hypothetical protein